MNIQYSRAADEWRMALGHVWRRAKSFPQFKNRPRQQAASIEGKMSELRKRNPAATRINLEFSDRLENRRWGD
ncbi:hypothetical protein, partial [Pseudomonas aeruginosa]|uniref:hypothetical protein n=2 Tax=Pseudomonas aeruginosa TaxID=287 RepID=UPI001968FA97